MASRDVCVSGTTRMVVGICALAALVCATLPGAAQALCMAWPMPPAYHQASRALRDGRVTDAVRLFRQAARYPGEEKRWVASAYAQAGGTALREQRYVEAAGHFRAAMSEVPSFYGVATGLLRSLEGAGRYHEALQAARQFPEGERDSPGTLRLRARLHALVRDTDGLRAVLSKLRALGPLERAELQLLEHAGGVHFKGPGSLGRL